MHELSITENILEIALRHGDQAKAEKITDLYLVIGQLSSIVDDSVQFYWDIIAKGTKAEGAELHFDRIKTQLKCKNCGHEYNPMSEDLACPICSCINVEIISGNEFYFDAIDVET
jgi:hydrogenase nickel incorporation protein HypA/HybF